MIDKNTLNQIIDEIQMYNKCDFLAATDILKSELEKEIKKYIINRNNRKIDLLLSQVSNINNKNINVLADFLAIKLLDSEKAKHHKYLSEGVDSPRKLGYVIAETVHDIGSYFHEMKVHFSKKEEIDILEKICDMIRENKLSISDYIFDHTHYDSCSNNFYYRMS